MSAKAAQTRRHPDGLIIGAMKSATTGLASDLSLLDGFFSPAVKEPEDLCHDAVLTAEGRARYLNLFKDADPASFAFEASTAYTKVPQFEGVPARASAVLGPRARLVYMVRDPLARALSQVRHEAIMINDGRVGVEAVFDLEALDRLGIFAFSDYERQLAPWLAAYGPDQLRIVRFEDYVSDRIGTVAAVAAFFRQGTITRASVERAIDVEVVHNPSIGRLEPTGLIGRFAKSDFYLRRVKGLLPSGLRARLKRGLSGAANPAWRVPGIDIEAQLAPQIAAYPAFLERHGALVLQPVLV